MKKLISLFLVLVLIASLGVTASAKTDGLEISPFYVAECPYGGKHDMVSNGSGQVYSGTYDNQGTELFRGFGWMCSKCGTALVTEGSPLESGIIGRYAQGEAYYTTAYLVIYLGNYGYTDSSYGYWRDDPYFGDSFQFRYP